MEEKAEAQGLLEASLQKISSTKRALGNGEVEEHQHIDTMLSFIRNHLGIDPSAAASVRLQCLRKCAPSAGQGAVFEAGSIALSVFEHSIVSADRICGAGRAVHGRAAEAAQGDQA